MNRLADSGIQHPKIQRAVSLIHACRYFRLRSFRGVVLVSVSFCLFVLLFLQSAGAIGPLIENHQVLVNSWRLAVPKTVLGYDKFGLRRGHYVLHIERQGREFSVPVEPEELSEFCPSHSWFADWNCEDRLHDLAKSSGKKSLILHFEGSYGWHMRVTNLEAVDGIPDLNSGDAGLFKAVQEHYYLMPNNDEPQYFYNDERAWKLLRSIEFYVSERDELYVDSNSNLLIFLWCLMTMPGWALVIAIRCAARD